MKLLLLELFAGTRSVGKVFEAHGHEVYSVEWDKDFENIDLYADIGTLTAVGNGEENIAVKNSIVRRLTPTECARLQGFADWWGYIEPKDALTDSEHRFWQDVRNTHAAINGRGVKDYTEDQMLAWYNKLHSDSAEYKMWGNGIALPTALYVMQGIADVLNERAA